MTKSVILPTGPNETPHYQRFVAYAVLLPIERGKRQYHRVVITGTHRDIEEDLSVLLPKQVRHVLRRSDSTDIKMLTSRKVESSNPNREAYFAYCSCGVSNCEHLNEGIQQFMLVQDLAENSGQILREIRQNRATLDEYSRKIDEASSARLALEGQLAKLEDERAILSDRLRSAQEQGHAVDDRLREELDAKVKQISELQRDELRIKQEKDSLSSERQELEQQNRNLQANLKTLAGQLATMAERKPQAQNEDLPRLAAKVIDRHFQLESCVEEPKSKLSPSVTSDHHKADNVFSVANRLAAIEFIRQISLSYRRNVKHSKVSTMPIVSQLELIVADGDNGNIFKIVTTAKTRAQQIMAAHLLAELFDAKVASN